MQNKEKKRELVERGIYKDFKIRQYQIYQECEGDDKKKQEKLEKIYKDDFKDLNQIYRAQHEQGKKIAKWLNYHVDQGNKIYFFTFTWSSKKRKGQKDIELKTLKKYCLRALKNADDYKLNFDWGEENGRVHMHGIAIYKEGNEYEPIKGGKSYNPKKKRWFQWYHAPNDEAHQEYKNKVGFLNIEKLEDTEEAKQKIKHYLKKLQLHALKENQAYITTKKGTDWQEHQRKLKAAKRKIKSLKKEHYSTSIEELKYYKETKYIYDHIMNQE